MDRNCKTCGTVLVQRENENDSAFNKRSHCNHKCSLKILAESRRKPKKNCKNCSKTLNKRSKTFCDALCTLEFNDKETARKIESGEILKSYVVKGYLIRKFGAKCMSPNCCWDWSKRSVLVELEHKDGNSENNSIENVELLCPNCHSETDTYKGKNRGKGRYYRRQRYSEGKSF